MPELPEVEVVRRGLERGVVGRTVRRVSVLHPRAVRRHDAGPADFESRLRGAKILSAQRRGKYLWLPLDSGEVVLGHLGMSGQLLVVPADKPIEKHLRIRWEFDDHGRELRFVDQRTFGGLALAPTLDGTPGHNLASGRDEKAFHGLWPVAGLPVPLAHIAPDPLEPAFDDAAFAAAVRRRRTGIKRALLDQSLISGVGNIYADEALWRVPLHWARATETMRTPDIVRLIAAVREVLAESLAAGGTSFDALYVSTEGVSGLFERELNVYGREGEPCRRCGTPIVREAFMNRSSHRCPRCQPRPRNPHW
jgi:formamidopyrimidine-DNA glycosylase